MKVFLTVTLFIFSFAASAQNLVPNGSFEEFTSCPGDFSQNKSEFRVKGWWSATQGTPDHFHSCSRGNASVPHNWAGVSEAFDGKGFTGIYLWMDNHKDYREYLQCRLTTSLIKDSVYTVDFRFKLSSYSRYAIDRIGLFLTDSAVVSDHDVVINAVPTFSLVKDSALTQKTGYWEKAHFDYKAKGGEQFLVLGNFFTNDETKFYRIQFTPDQQDMLQMSAYYYIDDVKVIQHSQRYDELLPEFEPRFAELNKTYVLRNILFEFNSYKLRSSSFEELDGVVFWLEQHPNARVVLSGHTDDVGGTRYNQKLSENRARSVAAYLHYQGIAEQRIETAGHGKSKPLIDSTTEEAREQNRRVEVLFKL
ncbi:MAG TPA: OmpA family protein [Ohtaekwangia sp.]